ncbi:MAG: hypothetical protein ACJAV5_000570 [Vicingaceae bacterium]|jgi:hypothetical protein
MKILCLVLVLLLASFSLLGQSKKAKPGYYYNLSGMKIEGDFVYSLPQYMKGKGKLIEYKDGKKSNKYTAEDIQGFVLEGDSFASLSFESEIFGMSNTINEFAKTGVKGEISLYYLYYTQTDDYLVRGIAYEKEIFESKSQAVKLGMKGVRFSFILGNGVGEKEGGFFEYTTVNDASKERLIKMVEEDQDLAQEIEGMKKFKVFGALNELIMRYNDWYITKTED